MHIADVGDVLGLAPGGAQVESGDVTMSLDTLLGFVERGVTADVLPAAEGCSMTAAIIFVVV